MSASSVVDTLEEVQSMGSPPRGVVPAVGRLASWAGDVLWHIELLEEIDWGRTCPELAEATGRVETHRILLEVLQGLADLEPGLRDLLRDYQRLQACVEEVLDEE